MRIDKKNSKKEYSKPELEYVFLDVALDEGGEWWSEGSPITEPELPFSANPTSQFGDSKYIFPDAPASENPFGGSSPSYK